jgi:hypothetical protein
VAGTRPFIRSTRQRHDGRLLRRAHRVVGRVRSEGAWRRPGPDARLDVAEREPDAVPRDGCAHRICREVAASAPAVACARVQACNGRHKSIDTDGPPLVPPSHKPEHAGRLHRASTCARRYLDHDPTAAAVLRQTRCTQEQASVRQRTWHRCWQSVFTHLGQNVSHRMRLAVVSPSCPLGFPYTKSLSGRLKPL